MALTDKELKPKGCVYFLNKLVGCSKDFKDLRSIFEELGFICFDISHIESYDSLSMEVQKFGEKERLRKDLPVIVFFYGFGCGNNLFLDSEFGETVSYKAFAETFSANRDEKCVFILFTTICFRKPKQKPSKSKTSQENIGNAFHICVNVEKECTNGSLMTRAVLTEIEEMKTQEDLEDFVYNVIFRIKELQKDIKDNVYVADTRFYGVIGKFYFEKTPAEIHGQDRGSTRLEIKRRPSSSSEEELEDLDILFSSYVEEEMTSLSSEGSFQKKFSSETYSESDDTGLEPLRVKRFHSMQTRSLSSEGTSLREDSVDHYSGEQCKQPVRKILCYENPSVASNRKNEFETIYNFKIKMILFSPTSRLGHLPRLLHPEGLALEYFNAEPRNEPQRKRPLEGIVYNIDLFEYPDTRLSESSIGAYLLPSIRFPERKRLKAEIKEEKSDYEEKDFQNLFRLRKMHSYVSTSVFLQVYHEATKSRKDDMSLVDYFQSKGHSEDTIKHWFTENEILQITNDPVGSFFDISLLYKCIRLSGRIVAKSNKETWKEGNASLESFLTAVLNRKEELETIETTFSEEQFNMKIEELSMLLAKILYQTAERSQLSSSDIEERVKRMTYFIKFLKVKPLIPINFAEYEKQVFLLKQGELVRNEGKAYLCKFNDYWTLITLVSHSHNPLKFRVDSVFTNLVLLLESTPGGEKLEFQDILNDINYTSQDPIILIEGIAGSGKTTLSKMILREWISGKSKMKGLDSYDFIFLSACNNTIRSFKELLGTCMSDVAYRFHDEDFANIVLDQKVAVILDGLDELNKSSSLLFQDILSQKKRLGLTVFVTTRPEKLRQYYQLVGSYQIKTKHIKLDGIGKDEIYNFATKYSKEMNKNNETTYDVQNLLEFLKNTAQVLDDLWVHPFNLVLFIISWFKSSGESHSITSASEVYWKIFKGVVEKVTERLEGNEQTRCFVRKTLHCKIETLVETLGNLALNSMDKSDTTISIASYERLVEACKRENIPPDEITGAFLKVIVKRNPFGFDTEYSFHYKGFQEFLGALRIFRKVVCNPQRIDVDGTTEKLSEFYQSLDFPSDLVMDLLQLSQERIKRYLEDTAAFSPTVTPGKTTSLRKILQQVFCSSLVDLMKYQGLLITLTKMLLLESRNTDYSLKREVLELLQEANIDRCQWLSILDAGKHDPDVASYVSKIPEMLRGIISINDDNLAIHKILFVASENPENDAQIHEADIVLDVKDKFPDCEGLLKEINRHQFRVKSFLITDANLQDYFPLLSEFQSVISDDHAVRIHIRKDLEIIGGLLNKINACGFNVTELRVESHFQNFPQELTCEEEVIQVMKRSKTREYLGALTSRIILPQTVKKLYVSLRNEDAFWNLTEFLKSFKADASLCISLCKETSSEKLVPVPPLCDDFILILPDVDVTNLSEAIRKAKNVQPFCKSFQRLIFPRCKLNEDVERLLKELKDGGVKVRLSVVLPKPLKPTKDEDEQRLQEFGRRKLGCQYGVEWEDEKDIWKRR